MTSHSFDSVLGVIKSVWTLSKKKIKLLSIKLEYGNKKNP